MSIEVPIKYSQEQNHNNVSLTITVKVITPLSHIFCCIVFFVTSADFSLIDRVKSIGECNNARNGKVSVIILPLSFQNIQVVVYVPSSHSITRTVSSKLLTFPICGI